MKYGIVKIEACSPAIRVGNPDFNAKAIASAIREGRRHGVEVAVFPELCVTGCTCGDLFFTRELADGAAKAVKTIAAAVPSEMIVFVGAPLFASNKLYNCCVAMSGGKILGVVPKKITRGDRYFAKPDGEAENVLGAPFGDMLFRCGELVIGCVVGRDAEALVSPSVGYVRAGANVIVNPSAHPEVVEEKSRRELFCRAESARLDCAFAYAGAGAGESVNDVLYFGRDYVCVGGDAGTLGIGSAICDVDVQKINAKRARKNMPEDISLPIAEFTLGGDVKLLSPPDKYPFYPSAYDGAERILRIQSAALKSRMTAIKAKKAVIGVSGGLDSALALLASVRAVGAKNVVAVTMPAFGTSETTEGNAHKLCAALGVSLRTVDIKNTVQSHLNDLDHDKKDAAYENAQARTRTMTLFDIANIENGIVVGTGDMSELALGWTTYNGDHMSSYGVNAGIPKTLVRYLVGFEAKRLGGDAERALNEISATPISPELLPAEDGEISQKTEEILGSYDLHDFILYYYVGYGFSREKIAFLLRRAFSDEDENALDRALDVFFKRFFAAQFKRSCSPDGVKVTDISLSPRTDFFMPSDLVR